MQKISTGEPSNLKTYRSIALVIGGFDENNPAVKFIDEKIKQSKNGEKEIVLADESQMVHLLITLAYELNDQKIQIDEELLKVIEQEGNSESGIYKGYRYKLNRNISLLFWCGYVTYKESSFKNLDNIIDCHGGITFYDEQEIGFDCGHSQDIVPAFPNLLPLFLYFKPVYRTKNFCRNECYKIIEQLIALEKEYEN